MCDYCNNEKNLYHAEDHGMTAIIEIVADTLIADLYTDYAELPINFCPMCGSKLSND